MKKTLCLTFPRSGHHLLVNVLLKYFGKDPKYKEISGNETSDNCYKIIDSGEFHYCEFYNHCSSFPCTDKNTTFQKNHDFDLKLKPINDFNYVVLYRHPLDSIVSLYNFYTRNPFINDDKFFGKHVMLNKEGWTIFAEEVLIFWKSFIKKWAAHKEDSHFFFLSYEELVKFPLSSIINLIKFIEPDKEIDIKLLTQIVDQIKIKPEHNFKDFKYYEEDFFRTVEKNAEKEIRLMDLDMKFKD